MKRLIKVAGLVIVLLALTIAGLEMSSSYHVTKNIHEDAPVVTKLQIVIDAPIDSVWKIFADVNQWPQWQKEIPIVKLTAL
ncbi:hypothetical protein DRW42_24040 [Pedobacter miscanthi]|uniref:Polyketide cyclase/dehydrase n=2 Tax=Pedobacter miscanthi TaxID=2259170 RepID=A0A366KMU7_9SPHI|nr:hypothetical protein DRW42_24040 [Pedobacter miscanthi]